MSGNFVISIPADATPIERDFLNALSRIVEGVPNSPSLRDLVKAGSIKPTQSNVALEAGHSRTLISGRDCPLPRVGVEIARAKESRRPRPRPRQADRDDDIIAEVRWERRERMRAVAERENMRRQRDAAHTSDLSLRILADALRAIGRKADPEVQRLRRLAEQTGLSGDIPPTSQPVGK